jgi:hypothetical protein
VRSPKTAPIDCCAHDALLFLPGPLHGGKNFAIAMPATNAPMAIRAAAGAETKTPCPDVWAAVEASDGAVGVVSVVAVVDACPTPAWAGPGGNSFIPDRAKDPIADPIAGPTADPTAEEKNSFIGRSTRGCRPRAIHPPRFQARSMSYLCSPP